MLMLCVGAMIAPGVGMSGRLLTQVPPVLLEWAHAPGYGCLAWLLTRSLQRRGWPILYALFAASSAAFVFGLWTEVLQGLVPGRSTSSDDLVVNAGGIILIACAVLVKGWADAQAVSITFKTIRSSSVLFSRRLFS
jgi:VanZ family protein